MFLTCASYEDFVLIVCADVTSIVACATLFQYLPEINTDMHKSRSLLIIVLVVLSSCNHGFSVELSNKTAENKTIRVIYPENYNLPPALRLGALEGYDHTYTQNTISSRDYNRYPVTTKLILLDTINRTYSFELKSLHDVTIESRYPAKRPQFGTVFIINEKDTIYLGRHGKDFRRRAGHWWHTIAEKK